MVKNMNLLELSFDFLGVSILDIGLLIFIIYLVMRNDTLDRRIATGYYQSCIFTIIVIACEMMTEILHTMGSEARSGLILFNILGFGLSTYLPLILAKVFSPKTSSYWLWTPVLVFSVILLTTPWNGWIFSVDAQNQYQRGDFFFLYVLAYGWGFLVVLKALIEHGKTLRQRNRTVIYGLMTFLVLGTAVQIMQPKFHTSWTVITFVIVIYYLFLCQMWFEYDTLTQVSNRSAFEKALVSIEHRKSVSILMIDLDDFKSVNDTYGHQQGDEFLKLMAGILQEHFQKNGDCYRIGGDEFCVICTRMSEPEQDNILEALEMKIQDAKAHDPRITGMSWGIAHYDCKGNVSVSEVWREADQKLYINKKAKKAKNAIKKQRGRQIT